MVPPKKDKPTGPNPELQPTQRRFSVSRILARLNLSRSRRPSSPHGRPATAPNLDPETNTGALTRYSERHNDRSLLSRPVTPRESCPYNPERLTPFGNYEESRPWSACGMVIKRRRTPTLFIPCEDCIKETSRSHLREKRRFRGNRGIPLDDSGPRPRNDVPADCLNGYPRLVRLPPNVRALTGTRRHPHMPIRPPTRPENPISEDPFKVNSGEAQVGKTPTRRGSQPGERHSPSDHTRPSHSNIFLHRVTPPPTRPISPRLHHLPHLPGRPGIPYVRESEVAQHEAALRAGTASAEVLAILERPDSQPREDGHIDFSETVYYAWPGEHHNRPTTPAPPHRPSIERVHMEVEVEQSSQGRYMHSNSNVRRSRPPSCLLHELRVEEMSSSSSDGSPKRRSPNMRGGGGDNDDDDDDEEDREWSALTKHSENINFTRIWLDISCLHFISPTQETATQHIPSLRGGGGTGWNVTDHLPLTFWWLAGGRGKPIKVSSWKKQKSTHRMGGLLGMAVYGQSAGTTHKSEEKMHRVAEAPVPITSSSSLSGSSSGAAIANAGSFSSPGQNDSGASASSHPGSSPHSRSGSDLVSSGNPPVGSAQDAAPAPGSTSPTTPPVENATSNDVSPAEPVNDAGDASRDTPAVQGTASAPGQ